MTQKNISFKSEDINDNEDFNLSIFLENVKRNKIIISGFTSFTFLLTILYVIIKSPFYEGKFEMLRSAKNTTVNSLVGASGAITNDSLTILTEVNVLKSPSVLLPVFNKYKERKISKGIDVSDLKFIDWVDGYLKVERENKTSILKISFFDDDKEIVSDSVKDIANAYQKYSTIGRTQYIDKTLKLLTNQTSLYREKFLNSYEKVLTYALENNLRDLDLQQTRGSTINLYENGRLDYGDKKRYLNEINNYFETIKNNEDKLLIFSKIYPNKYSDKIADLDKAYAFLKNDLNDSNIQLINNRKERKTYIKLLKVYLSEFLDKEIKENEFKFNAAIIPEKILLKYNDLLMEMNREKGQLDSLESQRRSLLLEQARDAKPWPIISEITIEEIKPSKIKFIIIGIFSGFFLGYIFAFIKDLKSSKIFHKEELRKILNSKELLFLSKDKLSIWGELINLLFSNLEFYSKEEDISLVKLGEIDKNNLKLLKEIIQTKFPKIKIKFFNNVFDSKESKNQLFISQLSKITKKELALFQEQRSLLKLESIDWILFDS